MEEIVTGYCRQIDQSRMVLVEDGDVGCDYDCCPYKPNCTLAKKIAALLEADA